MYSVPQYSSCAAGSGHYGLPCRRPSAATGLSGMPEGSVGRAPPGLEPPSLADLHRGTQEGGVPSLHHMPFDVVTFGASFLRGMAYPPTSRALYTFPSLNLACE